MTEPKVYVVQENPSLDYKDAERFGEVYFVTDREYSNVQGSLSNQQLITDVSRAVDAMNPATDYLLLTGNPITIGAAFSMAWNKAKTQGNELTLLRWDGISRTYVTVQYPPKRAEL